MPTGYTAAIADDISFNEFVMCCARGMGALILMRDEPWDAPIPERFEPSDHHALRLKEAHDTLAKLRVMSDADADAAAQEAITAETCANANAIARSRELRRKYEAMLSRVQDWAPPTPDHEGFKRFMVEQITGSIDFDCNESYHLERQPKQKTGKEWREEKIASAIRDIEYHKREHIAEVERTESRNAWLLALRESLKAPNVAANPR